VHKNSLFRINTGGNFCGHYPDAPQLYPIQATKRGKGGLPGVLTTLYDRLEQYYFKPGMVPSLNLANGSRRQMRSDRREACCRLLRVIVETLDVSSLRVGMPTPDGFINFTLDYLSTRAGLSLYRGRRAFRDLRQARLITVTQARKLNEQGEYRGLPAVKAVSNRLFALFGLQERLKHERKKAAVRLKRKAEQWSQGGRKRTLADIARFKLMNGAALASAGGPKKPFSDNQAPAAHTEPVEARRRRMRLATQLKQENPSWTARECNEEAERQLQQNRMA